MAERINKNKNREHFAVYAEECKKLPVFVSCNMEIDEVFQKQSHPYCLKVTFPIIVNTASKELISMDEFKTISQIEYDCCKSTDGIFVGHGIVAAQRYCLLMFYATKEGLEKLKDHVLNVILKTTRPYNIDSDYDPYGKIYRDILYPNETQLVAIDNIAIMRNLNENGDTGERPRNILFNSYFKDKESLSKCLEELKGEGLEFEDELEVKDCDDELPWMLVVKKKMPYDIPKVNELAFKVKELAEKYEGDYDGIETDLIVC